MNIYQQLGVEPLINAAGSLTALGGELMHPEVVEAIVAASHDFVDINELHKAAGQRIAEWIGVEAAHVCGSASAGITLMAAACMAGADQTRIAQLPDTSDMKNKFVVHRAHRNAFEHAIHIAGGQFHNIDADPHALVETLRRDDIAAVYYTFAWFCVGEVLPLTQTAAIAYDFGIPMIVDAAQVSPVQGFSQYIDAGADLIVFSGGKSLHGPQTSGVILGRKDLVEACTANDSPNIKCIGRGMKVSKESIIGLVKAVELYLKKDHAAELALLEQRAAFIIDALSSVAEIEARRIVPLNAGYPIPYVKVNWNEEKLGVTYQQLAHTLREGQPRIAVRILEANMSGVDAPYIRICVHTLKDGEEAIVVRRIKEILVKKSGE
ncbi:MAG: aminotransferase class V-fold PLP-dependent enzyme [bacterium]